MSIPLSVAIISTSFSMPNLSRNSFGITIRPSLSISFLIPVSIFRLIIKIKNTLTSSECH